MIAGRLHWRPPEAKLAGRRSLAAFDFPNGTLVLTEAGTKHRASLYVLAGENELRSADPGELMSSSADLNSFRDALTAENRTLKRALTDPRIVSGIGNAYSDEILLAAQLSPITLTRKLNPEEWERLFAATRETLRMWMDRLRQKRRKAFRRRSPRSAKIWRLTGSMDSRARGAARRFSGFATPTTKPTTARSVRPVEGFWQTGACRGCCEATGRGRWMS